MVTVGSGVDGGRRTRALGEQVRHVAAEPISDADEQTEAEATVPAGGALLQARQVRALHADALRELGLGEAEARTPLPDLGPDDGCGLFELGHFGANPNTETTVCARTPMRHKAVARSVSVPKTRPDPLPSSRYSRLKIGLEIRACFKARGRGCHSRCAEYLGMEPQQLSHYLDGTNKLEVEMVGAIADFMDAPPAWPFVPWEVARAQFGGNALRP